MNDNGLSNVMSLIKKQKWENLFKKRELMHTAAYKEFYANLTVFIYKKKEIAKSRVRGVEIEFDNMKLASILNVPGHTSISEYIKEEESGSNDQFFDAQVDVEEPVTEAPAALAYPASPGDSTTQPKEPEAAGVDPSGPSGHIPESVMIKLQAEFERAHANRIQSDLEKAQTENARFLALLQQAQSKPKP
ncbi:hypothetical protein Dimus_031978 [Dionaea muscipula]